MKYELYTDGACQPNPGTGGWAYIIEKIVPGADSIIVTDCGYQENTTNNRMELISILIGLRTINKALNDISSINITSDSQYAINGLSKWCTNWARQGWVKKDKKPVLNKELWISLMEVVDSLKIHNVVITYKHIPGHSGHPRNEQCDEMAVKAISNLRKKHV